MPKITAHVDLKDLNKKKHLRSFAHIKDRIQTIILSVEEFTAQEIAAKKITAMRQISWICNEMGWSL